MKYTGRTIKVNIHLSHHFKMFTTLCYTSILLVSVWVWQNRKYPTQTIGLIYNQIWTVSLKDRLESISAQTLFSFTSAFLHIHTNLSCLWEQILINCIPNSFSQLSWVSSWREPARLIIRLFGFSSDTLPSLEERYQNPEDLGREDSTSLSITLSMTVSYGSIL